MKTLLDWLDMSRELKRLKVVEMELRKELCDERINLAGMKNGRMTTKGAEGDCSYKIVTALGYKVDLGIYTALLNNLTEAEKACVRWKPELALAAYKKLPEDSLLHEAVISKMAAPVLTVEVRDDNRA